MYSLPTNDTISIPTYFNVYLSLQIPKHRDGLYKTYLYNPVYLIIIRVQWIGVFTLLTTLFGISTCTKRPLKQLV